jgi:hypothetical protein
MDTQGSGAQDIDKQQSAVIYGLTTIISSRLIYNVPQRLDENLLDYLDFLTTFAGNVDDVSADSTGKPFGDLSLWCETGPPGMRAGAWSNGGTSCSITSTTSSSRRTC